MEIRCPECSQYLDNDHIIVQNQKKTQWVVIITSIMMVGEIVAGYMSKSMALTADGFHMASHAGALLIALVAYNLARSQQIGKHFSFGAGKLIPLGGYTSAVVLGIVALLVFIESVTRLFDPVSINFSEAIGVAVLGFLVNVVSAIILNHDHSPEHNHSHHHEHEHHDQTKHHSRGHLHGHVHDHNIRSAFLHILADAVTSFLAVLALIGAKQFGWNWLDPIVGIVGAIVIFLWAFQLCKDTGWELLDGHSKAVDWSQLRSAVEVDGARILDFHIWRIAPRAVACELVVESQVPKGLDHYRGLLRERFSVQHIVVEERLSV